MPAFDLPLAELERYRPDVPEPADLDAFWAATLAQARGVPPLVSAQRVDTGLSGVDTWDVTFAGFGADPVRAWYARPAGTAGAVLPAVVEFLGYGRGRGRPQERILWPAAGYAHLLMDSRGQGGTYGSGGDTPDPAGSGPAAPGVLTRGILDPAEHYYRRLFTDGVRAVDTVRALPGVDPTRVAAVGNSQGGGVALAVAGLVPDLAALVANVPFLSHVRRGVELTDQAPYGELSTYLSVRRDQEAQAFRTLSYLDGVVHARRAQAPALFSAGLRDTICPPSTVYAAFAAYGERHTAATGVPVPKEIVPYPWNGHEGGDAVQAERQLHWMHAVL